MEELALKPSEKVSKTFTSPDKLRKESPFSPTYLEWLSKHGQQITAGNNIGVVGAHLVYSVPKGHIFYLMSCSISINCTGAGPASRRGTIVIKNATEDLLRASITGQGTSNSNSISFPTPVKLDGEINLNLSANLSGGAVLQGFLLPNNLIPQF